MTGVGRAAERANRRRQRRQNIRMAVAGFCLAAGLILVVTLEFRLSDHRAASFAPPTPSSSAAQPSAGSPTGYANPAASTAPLPLTKPSAGDQGAAAAFSDPGTVATVLASAKVGVQAVDSYDYHDLNAAIENGLSATTGEFQTSYRAAMTGAVASTAPANQTTQTCTVQKVGLSSLSSDGMAATALVIGRLQTQDLTTGTTPRDTSITLGVSLVAVNGSWLISGVSDLSTGSAKIDPPGTGALYAATQAGAQEVLNLLTFTRVNYSADFGRALTGLTGPLLTEQESQRNSILAAMNSAGMDYSGEVRAVGIETVSDDSVTLLVAASSYQVDAAGKKTLQTLPEIEVGVVRVNGQWLVDQFLSIGSG